MKHIFRLFLVCAFLAPFMGSPRSSALAEPPQDLPAKGTIGKSDKLAPFTDTQLQEALAVSDQCKNYRFTSLHYDCDCVGMKFLELRQQKGDAPQAFWLRKEAEKLCPNTPAMAGQAYTQCLDWAPTTQGENYQSFCACYGSEYAKLYGRNTTDNPYQLQALMTKALTTCDANRPNREKEERKSMIDQMKKDGIYNRLFPSADVKK